MKVLFTVFSIIFFLLSGVYTQGITWEIDKAHTSINFSISHMVISDVTGKFNQFEGDLITSSDDFSDSQVNIVIKTASINTDNEQRDGHLRSADFFDAEKYPEITFKSRSFKKTGEKSYRISGELTMHGKVKEVVFDAKLKGVLKDPWGNTRAGFKATTTIDRYDFDIVYNSTLETGGLLIGKTVAVEVNIEILISTFTP
jgi:polyisoprenoid-binding protein YceI